MLIGIDPGLTGAIAWLDNKKALVNVVDMPLMASTGKKQQINAAELSKILNLKYKVRPTVIVERVSAMPEQGVTAMFNFGLSYGVIQGVVAALQLPMVLVTPGAWKKKAGLSGKSKDAARALAQQYYPEAALGRKKDIGRADAILIARFGVK